MFTIFILLLLVQVSWTQSNSVCPQDDLTYLTLCLSSSAINPPITALNGNTFTIINQDSKPHTIYFYGSIPQLTSQNCDPRTNSCIINANSGIRLSTSSTLPSTTQYTFIDSSTYAIGIIQGIS